MLTGAQLRTVAYTTEHGDVVCTDCAFPREPGDDLQDEICAYSADESEDGLYCDDCGKEISEPHPRYFTVSFEVEVTRDTSDSKIENELSSWLESLDFVQGYNRLEVEE